MASHSSVDKIFLSALEILRRDIKRLSDLSIIEKLSHANSQDLVAYIKALREIKTLDEEFTSKRRVKAEVRARSVTTAQLEALKRINEARKVAKLAVPAPVKP